MVRATICNCLDPQYESQSWSELTLHSERQDTSCDAWRRLLDLVEQSAHDALDEFAPRREMSGADWIQIVTLPATIAKLKAVKHLMLYGSNLVRIPPEIGEMTALEKFTPYTSYRLHYFPYEITRCPKLKESRVSTRALYGNYKYRPHSLGSRAFRWRALLNIAVSALAPSPSPEHNNFGFRSESPPMCYRCLFTPALIGVFAGFPNLPKAR